MQLSGFIDGYYSYNANHPSEAADNQINGLYAFNDKTDQVNLSAVKLTLNHDPSPVGAHLDLLYGRTDEIMNGPAGADNLKYTHSLGLRCRQRGAQSEVKVGNCVGKEQ